jgi:hypothetical protein
LTNKRNRKLPPDNHIIRYVPWTRLRKNKNDEVIGILGDAFKLREGEQYLSATWLEFFNNLGEEPRIEAIRAIRLTPLIVRPKSGFAIGKVSTIQSACMKYKVKNVRIIHSPNKSNEAELFEHLATEAWAELILNEDVQG